MQRQQFVLAAITDTESFFSGSFSMDGLSRPTKWIRRTHSRSNIIPVYLSNSFRNEIVRSKKKTFDTILKGFAFSND